MSSTYRTVLETVATEVQAITGLVSTPCVLRKEAVLVALQDRQQQVVVAPRADLAEVVEEMAFGTDGIIAEARISYEVYVLLVTRQVWDLATLWYRLDRREEIRLALWRPTLLQSVLPTQYDSEYDPSPAIDLSWLSGDVPLDATCQKFSYKCWQPAWGE